jgi:formamidase
MEREHIIRADAKSRLASQPTTGHNRWHEDIAPILEIAPGDTVTMDVRDGFDGQVPFGMPSADLAEVSLAANHPLTGPIYIK